MKRVLIFAAAVLMAFSQTAGAGAQVPPPATELRNALTALRASVNRLPDSLRSARLTGAVGWLENNYSKTRPETVSEEYARSLQRASDLLSRLPTAEAVEDVTSELEARVDHCRRLGIGMGGVVLLRVNTRHGAQVVGDWEVLYLLKFDEWLKTPPRNFLRVSSPTEMNLEPGRYWIWARDPATQKTGNRVLVQVSGQTELMLDLPVP
jgi:hypothetical protein